MSTRASAADRLRVAGRRIGTGHELLLVAALYVGYSAARVLADDDLQAARGRAADLLRLETDWHLDVEHVLNAWFARVDALGVAGSFWYATAHYVVTLVVLVWLFRRDRVQYLVERRVLVLASLLGLAVYLAVPMAPPRLVDGYTDVLALHADVGWWGADASAPQGLGQLTNELAAFPSLHAGWALWVAIAVARSGAGPRWRVLAATHVAITAVVVVGTGNHWVLDVVGGWVVVLVAVLVVDAATRRAAPTLEP